MMEKLLITGASGLLGLNFALRFLNRTEVVGVANQTRLKGLPFRLIHAELTGANVIRSLLDSEQPDLIIHCAAMANVDQCEKDPAGAMNINGIIPGELAEMAFRRKIRLIHISTDAVFDGRETNPAGYRETDAPNPINVYAASKLLGEQNVLAANADALVARVNFYGWSLSGRRSLSEFFYNNLRDGLTVSGFSDVLFTPLYVGDLADFLWKLAAADASGLIHVFSSQTISKYQFGCMIARRFGLNEKLIREVSWQDAGLKAVRSPNLTMNTEKITAILGENPPDQQSCLDHFYQDWKMGLPGNVRSFQAG